MAWGKYLSPRKFVDAGESDVEGFLQYLADQGKAGWQIEQAEAALKLLHQSRYPAPWSADWKVRQPLAAATASPERRPPLNEEFLRARHQGKSDRGELPPRFAPFIDEIRAAVRARHYSYRTEQIYVGWIRSAAALHGAAASIAQRNPTWLLPVSGGVPRRAVGR